MSYLSEYDTIKEAINYYIDGAINRDYEMLCKGWHPECRMFGITNEDQLSITSRDAWKDRFDKPIDDPNYFRVSEILTIDVSGKAANAKVKTTVATSTNIITYIDYLNLLKIGENWQIVNKIFDATIEPKIE
ncbi:MAG: nuclear transport factor 2 family protein [Asgard group archaeon]|nr:nuclear transport factor 2 family protein [Asgard group archaeon]